MTALELIDRAAIKNRWLVISARQQGCHFIVNYGRNGIFRERVEVRYSPSYGVHSACYLVGFSQAAFIGPAATGRRAAVIEWFKL